VWDNGFGLTWKELPWEKIRQGGMGNCSAKVGKGGGGESDRKKETWKKIREQRH